MGVRGAQNDVDDIGKLRHEFRKRVEHVFDAFVRRKQSESQQHLLALHAKLVLVKIRSNKRDVGNAMRNEIDLCRRRLVNLLQDLSVRVPS